MSHTKPVNHKDGHRCAERLQPDNIWQQSGSDESSAHLSFPLTVLMRHGGDDVFCDWTQNCETYPTGQLHHHTATTPNPPH